MNTSHYPNIELCRKLTEIGFPETDVVYFANESIPDYISNGFDGTYNYICPSVMELLEVMPIEIRKDDIGYMLVLWGNGCIQYYPDNFNSFHIPLADFRSTLPNALSEMVLWLNANNYISFNK